MKKGTESASPVPNERNYMSIATTKQTTSDTGWDSHKSICGGRHTLWYEEEDETVGKIHCGAPAHLVVQVLELLAPMVEAQAATPYYPPAEYLQEVTSQPSWDVVAEWVLKTFEASCDEKRGSS